MGVDGDLGGAHAGAGQHAQPGDDEGGDADGHGAAQVRPSVMITGDGACVVMSWLAPPCPLPLPWPVAVSPLATVGSSDDPTATRVAAASASGDRAPVGVPEEGVVITIGAWEGCGVVGRTQVRAARPSPTAG